MKLLIIVLICYMWYGLGRKHGYEDAQLEQLGVNNDNSEET